MKQNWSKKKKKKINLATVAVIALAAVFVFIVSLMFTRGQVKADVDPDPEYALVGSEATLSAAAQTTVSITSIDQLIAYSREYALGGHNPNDVLELSLSDGIGFILPSEEGGFVSLGKGIGGASDRPFNGTIKFAENATRKFYLDKPLFYKVTSDAQIISNTTSQPIEIEIFRISQNLDQPIFAGTVTKGATNSGSSKWIVIASPDERDSGNKMANNTAGLIGTIKSQAKVSVEFTDNAKTGDTVSNIFSAGNVGLICGTMESQAELTVKINTGTNTSFSITSTGGQAGGIVGEMKDMAKLTFDGSYTSPANVISETRYAGGIVGNAQNADVVFPVSSSGTVTVSKSVSGNGGYGAGGLYGYYYSTKNNAGSDGLLREFDFSDFHSDSSFEIVNGRNAGGIIGNLVATNDVDITAGESFADAFSCDRKVKLNGGINRGGIIGAYDNTAGLGKSLTVHDIRVEASTNADPGSNSETTRQIGGIIGRLTDSSKGNYVKIADVAVKNTGSKYFSGALIGDMGSQGSFLDVEGHIAATGNYFSGLVLYQRKGVIRLKGYTDLGTGGYFGASAAIKEADERGQLVGFRGDGLVYALGTGDDSLSGSAPDQTTAGWYFLRPNAAVDDIGDWGEVLRLNATSGITENTSGTATGTQVLTFDSTNHTVTIAAPVLDGSDVKISSIVDFVKNALNIQHNVSGQPMANGALRFEDTTNTSTALLVKTFKLTADISLANSGIVALTRDNGSNAAYSGTFNGNGHTVTLAIGEAYGRSESGAAVSTGYNNYGTVFRHSHQGLFAKTGNATFSKVTVSGIDNTMPKKATNIGGLVAEATGNLTLQSVTMDQTDNVGADAVGIKCGGAVGCLSGSSSVTLSVAGGTFKTVINDDSTTPANSKYFGGIIGSVDNTNTGSSYTFTKFTESETGYPLKLDGKFIKTNDKAEAINFGGLVGYFATTSVTPCTSQRAVTVNNVTVGDNMKISAKNMMGSSRDYGMGAFLGGTWNNVNVTIGTAGSSDGVVIGDGTETTSPTIELLSGSTNGNIGALFYKATGHMAVNHVNVAEAAVTSPLSGSTFGFIVNDAISGSYALYLDVDSSNYNIAATSIGSAGNFDNAFDEICAYSKVNGRDLADNGQAIISITLPKTAGVPAGINTSGSVCNTYQNQTTYAKKINANTRYYYNLDYLRGLASPTDPQKLLMWSVKQYAHSSLKTCFTNGFTTTISGTCDMEGLSYYPVDASGMTISSGTTIKFYNDEIETLESAATGNTDSSVRSTRITVNESQHRLMHEGIFRNYTGNLTVGGLTLQGNVSNKNTGYSGFLVCGTLGNHDVIDTISLNDIVLDGGKVIFSSGTAPLLINNIGSNVNVTVSGVTQTANCSGLVGTAATSLIGDVGSDTAENISLNFSRMVLDARTAALSDGTANNKLNTAYKTTGSIFTRATFLNSFAYLTGGSAKYNYNHDEDWGATLHQVTYAKEITSSTEFSGLQKHYYDDEVNFTSPISGTATTETFSFATGFLPHVYSTTGSLTKHEVRVNVREVSIDEGCGQYNDPYIISKGGQLTTIASFISGVENDGVSVRLPDDLGADNHKMWHDSGELHHDYVYSSTDHKFHYYGAEAGAQKFNVSGGTATKNPSGTYVICDPADATHSASYSEYFRAYNAGDGAAERFNISDSVATANGSGTYVACSEGVSTATGYLSTDLRYFRVYDAGDEGATRYNISDSVATANESGTYVECSEGESTATGYLSTSLRYFREYVEGDVGLTRYSISDSAASVAADGAWVISDSATANTANITASFRLYDTTLDFDDVREYLAGAYYSLSGNISLSSGFVGLGKVETWTDTNYECPYAFRGVIIGNGHTIANTTDAPLIYSANGCVVKDVTVSVSGSITVSQQYNRPFRYDSAGCSFYGAVIGQVMGGDNIIDKVAVGFTGATFTYGASDNTYGKLVPVGGYVGVIVNGGVIFREMDLVSAANRKGLTLSGSGKIVTFENITSYLYINPIIGRVIEGYAFNEYTTYAKTSAYLDNGTKNYTLCDLKPTDANKLNVTADSASNHEVEVPNAQSLYILSCVVNTGAGSASWSSSAINGYAAINNTPWIAYRNYTSTRCADYNQVGESAALGGDYATVETFDKYSGTDKAPYIVKQYTNLSGTVYHARSVCGNGGNAAVSSITLTGSGEYELPSSYRGIGNNYSDDNAFKLRFNTFDGNNDSPKNIVVKLNMYLSEYDYNGSNSNDTRNSENYTEIANPGFGLFNKMYQTGVTGESEYSIKDLTLSGTVKHEAIKLSSASRTLVDGYMTKTENNGIKTNRVISVGGLAGYTDNSFRLNNVLMNGLTVSSMKYGGGLIGWVSNTSVAEITECGTGSAGISVDARARAGGMIGYVNGGSTRLEISQAASSTKKVVINLIEEKFKGGKNDYGSNQWVFEYYSAGGLIGCVDCNDSNNVNKITVQNVKTEGKEGQTWHLKTAANHLNCRDVAGGIIGTVLSTGYTIDGVTVSGLKIRGGTAGGIVGFDAFAKEKSGPAHVISKATVDGGIIQAIRGAGGLIGKSYRNVDKCVSETTMSKNNVKNLTIRSIGRYNLGQSGYKYRDDCTAGTAIGGVRTESGYTNSGVYRFTINDFYSYNCLVYTLYEEANTETVLTDNVNTYSGTGGLVGALIFKEGTVVSDKYSLYGRNILLDRVKVNNYGASDTSAVSGITIDSSIDTSDEKKVNNARTTGYVCGNNMSEATIKIVGFSYQNGNPSEIKYIVGKIAALADTDYLGTGGYVVMADYNGVSAGNSKNTANPSVDSTNDITNVSPYVPVNPVLSLGNTPTGSGAVLLTLTGDGVAVAPTGSSGLPITNIAAEDKRYAIATRAYSSVFAPYSSKFSTYNAEQSASMTNDFAVLICDDANRTNTTAMVNAYLNLLANTDFDYTNDAAGKYSVVLSSMTWDDETGWTKNDSTCNLKRDTVNGKFYIDITSVDSGRNMFSLIDVRYYDPSDTSESPKVAYHLYVPVLVKKMLNYEFRVAFGSGTIYERAWYGDRYGDPLMENLGNPVTMYFNYKYDRSQSDWQTVLENGDNLLRNYAKVINATSSTQLPGDTVLVLVDPQKGGKAYYGLYSEVYVGGQLVLANFRDQITKAGGTYTVSGNRFVPNNFNDWLNITATPVPQPDVTANPSGVYFVQNSTGATAQAKIGGTGSKLDFRLATDLEKEDGSVDKFTLVVTNEDVSDGDPATPDYVDVTESYYVTIFTNPSGQTAVPHYTVNGPDSFGDPSYPSRIGDINQIQNGEGVAHLIIGNIFEQSGFTVAATTVDQKITTSNDSLSVDMQATVRISASAASEVSGYLADSAKFPVYHSFLLNLTKIDDNGSHKIIDGSPDGSASTYSIASVSSGAVATNSGSYSSGTSEIRYTNGDNYVEFSHGQKLNTYLISGGGAVVSSTLTLEYISDDNISKQFPQKDDQSYGVTVSGNSNVGFDFGKTAYAKGNASVAASDDNEDNGVGVPRGNGSPDHLYYREASGKQAQLVYSSKSNEFDGDYGTLGINPLDSDDQTEIRISTIATLKIFDIYSETIEPGESLAYRYDMLRLSIKLFQKNADGYYNESSPLALKDYIKRIWLSGTDSDFGTTGQTEPPYMVDWVSNDADPSGTVTELIFNIPRSWAEAHNMISTDLTVPIELIVYTGEPFETAGHTYANFKIEVTACLYKVEGAGGGAHDVILASSVAKDYIIYTNARLYPDYLSEV